MGFTLVLSEFARRDARSASVRFLIVVPIRRSLPTVSVSPAARITEAFNGSGLTFSFVVKDTKSTPRSPTFNNCSFSRFVSQLALVEKISSSFDGSAPGRPTQTFKIDACTAMRA
ncbi:hypothetical protein FQZ97_1044830 [compost metagenome]